MASEGELGEGRRAGGAAEADRRHARGAEGAVPQQERREAREPPAGEPRHES